MDYYDTPTVISAPNSDKQCADLVMRLMESEQNAIAFQNDILQQLQTVADQTGRSDIAEFIADFKDNQLSDEMEHYDFDSDWYAYFASIDTDTEISGGSEEAPSETETDSAEAAETPTPAEAETGGDADTETEEG